MTNKPVIYRAENICYSYFGKITALDYVSFEIIQGDRFAFIGSNGSGKTTLLHILSGLLSPDSGKLMFRDTEVTEKKLKDKKFSMDFRQRVGIVFQNSDVQLFCPTVYDELMFGPLQMGLDEKEADDRVHGVMKMLNIEKLEKRPTYMLSGGEKKRTALGSILTMNPDVLILDEPSGELDPKTQGFLVDLMYELNEAGKTILFATHDLGLVDDLVPRVAVLSEAHEIEKIGTCEDILKDEDLLLKVNLIHEHYHLHGDTLHRHKHSHFKIHRH
jgi:cobalt/nickel transport system ATP-binding protein